MCDLDAVREVVRARAVTRLPGSVPWVLGIMNVRGVLLTVVDLSLRFGGSGQALPAFVMVVEGAGRRFGIGVEAVYAVTEVAGDAIEPAGADDASDGIVGGIARLGDGGGAARWCIIETIAREALAV